MIGIQRPSPGTVLDYILPGLQYLGNIGQWRTVEDFDRRMTLIQCQVCGFTVSASYIYLLFGDDAFDAIRRTMRCRCVYTDALTQEGL